SVSRVKLTADASEQLVRLSPKASAAVRIFGQILDAQSRQPVAGGRVQIWETMKEASGALSTFTTRAEDVAADGQFRLKTASGDLSYVIEAQADGYTPERITNQVTSLPEVRLEIELKRAADIGGLVLTPTGESAAGATLQLCGHNENAMMHVSGK